MNQMATCSSNWGTILGYLKDLLSMIINASVFSGAIFRHPLSKQRFARHRLSLILSSRILTSSAAHMTSASSAKPIMLDPAGRFMRRKSSYMTFQTSGPTGDPWGGATCHLFFEKPLVALVYDPPVAQIVIYHLQQVVWNLFPHHRLDADVPPCGIERIAYVNADQRVESLTLTSSSSCFSGNVHHCLDGVNCGPAFSKTELVFRETVLADHVTL